MKKLFRSVRSTVEGWFGSLAARRSGRRPSPALELLEDRMVPAAMTFQVTNNLDEVGGDAGTSLREAINAANANLNPPGETDTITFQGSLRGAHIRLSLGEIDITDDVVIRGLGKNDLTIHGAEGSRIFHITNGGEALPEINTDIRNVKLRDGDVAGLGGAILQDAAGALTIQSCIVENNASSGDGGAIQMGNADLTVTDSVFRRNFSGDDGGAIDGVGDLDILRSTFRRNEANDVAGAIRTGGQTNILASTFDRNSAGSQGGAIRISNGATLLMLDSTVSRNRAFSLGGGLLFAGGEGVVANSTISNNRAGSLGGGVYVEGNLEVAGTGAEQGVIFLNATIAQNRVAAFPRAAGALEPAGGEGGPRGGGIFVDSGRVSLENTIVAGNTDNGRANDLATGLIPSGISGDVLIDAQFSLVQAPNGEVNGLNRSNLFGVSPQLGALTNNGGPTETHLPAFTSPVINAGSNQLLRGEGGADGVLEFDQRQIMVRIFDGIVDIGAVEVGLIAIRHWPLG